MYSIKRDKCACCGREIPEYDNLWSGIYDDVCIDCEGKVNDMENLIKRRQMLDEWEIDYEELVQCEKKRVEQRMWDLVSNGDAVWGWEINQYLEDMIPSPICWR